MTDQPLDRQIEALRARLLSVREGLARSRAALEKAAAAGGRRPARLEALWALAGERYARLPRA